MNQKIRSPKIKKNVYYAIYKSKIQKVFRMAGYNIQQLSPNKAMNHYRFTRIFNKFNYRLN